MGPARCGPGSTPSSDQDQVNINGHEMRLIQQWNHAGGDVSGLISDQGYVSRSNKV